MSLLRSILALACLCLPWSVARSEPVRPERLPADTRWVIHVDLDALRATDPGRVILDRTLLLLESPEQGMSLSGHLNPGIDLRTELRSLTLCGPQAQRQRGLAILDIDPEASVLLEGTWVRFEPDLKPESLSQQWVVDDRIVDGRRLLLLSDAVGDVRSGVEVLEGKRESLSSRIARRALPAEFPHREPELHLVTRSVPIERVHKPDPASEGQDESDSTPQPVDTMWPLTEIASNTPTPASETPLIVMAARSRPEACDKDDSVRTPAIRRTRGILARMDQTIDEVGSPWVSTRVEMRMEDQAAAASMEQVVRALLDVLQHSEPANDALTQRNDSLLIERHAEVLVLSSKQRLDDVARDVGSERGARGLSVALRLLRRNEQREPTAHGAAPASSE